MRKLFIFIVTITTIVWFFYSWEFYTCKIKWFCKLESKNEKIINNNKILKKEISQIIEKPKTDIWMVEEIEEIKEVVKKEKIEEKIEKEIDCKDIITLPIKYWSNTNNSLEVEYLEKFLNEIEGAKLEINGIYDKEDYEEVKKFQLKYRKDILDPWWIKIPTWYVYNTTIKKINEIYCLNIK